MGPAEAGLMWTGLTKASEPERRWRHSRRCL